MVRFLRSIALATLALCTCARQRRDIALAHRAGASVTVRTRVLAMLAAVALSGCGGGGSAVSTGASPTEAPGAPASSMRARFTIVIPAASTTSGQRHVAYVSPSTQSVVITLLTVGGASYSGQARRCS
jgi:hypothetical protein